MVGALTLGLGALAFIDVSMIRSIVNKRLHKGSAESKDSDKAMQAALRRIEKRFGIVSGDDTW